jgi:hypothetical protein
VSDGQRPAAGGPAKLFASSSRAAERHLVMVQQPGWQAIEDWYAIASRVVSQHPTIAVIVVSAIIADEAAAQYAAGKPTLVFAPGPLGRFSPRRGKLYHGRPIHKFEQLRRLDQAGVSVPRSMLLRPDSTPDPAEWGEFVVVKPTHIGSSSHGKGVTLMRTQRVRYIAPEDYPEGHPGRLGPMLVQQFINTGKRISYYRVLTLFGRPLVCMRAISPGDLLDLSGDDDAIESNVVALQAFDDRERKFEYRADVVAMAEAAYRAIPEAPLQGCDIIREAGTGRLYVLELNPGGNTWHFSSAHGAQMRADIGPTGVEAMHNQLDAFGTAAQVLAERTQAEAQ